MLFSIKPKRRALLAELNYALTISPHNKAGNSVELHTLFDATGGNGQVSLRVTNYDESLLSVFACQVDTPGKIALPTRKLHDYVRLLTDNDIAIRATEPNAITVRAGRSQTRFTGISPDGFPKPKLSPTPVFRFDPALFAAALRRTSFAVCTEEHRFQLNCLLLDLNSERTRFVSTDGNRLAMVEFPGGPERAKSILIPRTGLDPLLSFADSAQDNEIALSVDESQIYFVAGTRLLTTRRASGNFPHYEAVLPAGQRREMTIGRQPLLDAIEHTRQFTGNTKVGIKFQVREDVIEITSASSEFGEAKEAIEVEAAGEPFVAGYNAEYICEFLKAIETSPRIRFAFKDRESAAELRPGELQAPYIYRYVLMPCAVG